MYLLNLLFSTDGKTSRLEYLFGILFTFIIILFLFGTTSYIDFAPNSHFFGFFILSCIILYFYCGIAITTKRLKDANYPSWLICFILIPVIDVFFKIYLLIPPSKTEVLEKLEDSNQKKPSLISPNNDFFTASTQKYIIMFFCTFGLYNLYWFYKNWLVMKNSGINCWPIVRTIFSKFIAYDLFLFIKNSAKDQNITLTFPAGLLALSYLFIFTLGRLPDPYSLLVFLSFIPIMITNRVALAINKSKSTNFIPNDKFSTWNWIAIILGGLMIALLLLSIFVENIIPN